MSENVRNALFEAWAFCDMEDKSTEFMFAYMQDMGDVDLDTVLDFIEKESKNRSQWYKDNPNWFDKYQ